MATLNRGTLFVATAVPQYLELTFPIVLSNDIMGGIHKVTTSTRNTPGQGFSLIVTPRRQWGMLAYVEDEKKTYQLRPVSSSVLSNDNNWIEFSSGGSGGGLEWIDSVINVSVDASGISSPLTGDRYLISSNPSGTVFGLNKNKIATYDEVLNGGAGGWSLGEPVNGSTLRVDAEPGVLYTFTGTSSVSGRWTKEYQNTVRYIEPTSANGKTFSFITNTQTPLSGYTYAVYYANFATSNSGTVSLSIDGNFYAPVYKAANGVLTELVANDFESGIRYQLTYDSGAFQINLPSSGSGVIGEAEDVNGYSDGLFTDFTTSTPVGTAVDRFNEILKFLVPTPAPDLSSWDVTNKGIFKAGKISYSYADQPGLSIISTTFSDIVGGSVTLGGLFAKDTPSRRLGVKAYGSGNIVGILNSGVNGHPGQPSPAYATYSFGNGITGSVVLYVNDVAVSTVDLLTTYGVIDTTTTGNSGLILSAATASKFSTGTPFENFWNRTGTFLVKYDDPNINDGFNSIQVKHILPASTLTLSKIEFLNDSSTDDTFFNNAFVNNYENGATKYLSGIQYYTSPLKFQHNQQSNNIYKNTYYPDSDAGTFTDETAIDNSPIYNAGVGIDGNYQTNSPIAGSLQVAFTPDGGAFQALEQPSDVDSSFTFTKKFSVLPDVRKIAGRSRTFVTAKRTVQSTVKSTELLINGWFIDTFGITSTNVLENFDDENRRLTIADYNTVSSLPSSGNWNSLTSIRTTNALQVADGRLLYPHYNFTLAGDIRTNPNFNFTPALDRNYKNCKTATSGSLNGSGSRTYIRAFRLGKTPPKARFNVSINFNSTVFTSASTPLTGGNNSRCILEFKLPWDGTTPFGDELSSIGGAATGWLDAYSPALPRKFADRDGCLEGTPPVSSGTWKIDFGTRNTAHSDGWLLMRFTAGSEWAGYIESITISEP
jgi:hypothetical protein